LTCINGSVTRRGYAEKMSAAETVWVECDALEARDRWFGSCKVVENAINESWMLVEEEQGKLHFSVAQRDTAPATGKLNRRRKREPIQTLHSSDQIA
jgi:hypothetical protein